jgi:hypothetical protein
MRISGFFMATCIAFSMLVLAACTTFISEPQPSIGPISSSGILGTPDTGVFDYVLTSSTNCAIAGEPIALTFELTNNTSQSYSNTLPSSILDLEATATLTTTEHTWLWSDTAPVDQQIRTLSLDPHASVRLDWDWIVDPRLRQAPPPKNVYIRPLIRYRDVHANGRVTEFKSGSALRIPVDEDIPFACPISHP